MAGATESITILELSRQLQATIQRMSDFDLAPVLKQIGVITWAEHKTRFNRSMSPEGIPWVPLARPRIISGSKNHPLLDTGALRNSIQAKATRDMVIVSSNREYAGVHQWGATIVPVKAKFLCIPLTKEAKYAGSPRRFKRPLSPRVNKQRTKGVLLEKIGNREIVHYAMVKQVVIPARPFLGFSKDLLAQIEELLVDAANAMASPLVPRSMFPPGKLPSHTFRRAS
jgi:phage gpG-like protein